MGLTGQLDSQCVYHLAPEGQRHRQSIPGRGQIWVCTRQAGGTLVARLCRPPPPQAPMAVVFWYFLCPWENILNLLYLHRQTQPEKSPLVSSLPYSLEGSEL